MERFKEIAIDILEGLANILIFCIFAYVLVNSFLSKDDSNESQSYFMGNECTNDCSGHEAGYNWAEKNDISNPDDCANHSKSFEEGCLSYIR